MALAPDLQRAWHDFIVAETRLDSEELTAAVTTAERFTAWVRQLSAEDQNRVRETMVADGIALHFAGFRQ